MGRWRSRPVTTRGALGARRSRCRFRATGPDRSWSLSSAPFAEDRLLQRMAATRLPSFGWLLLALVNAPGARAAEEPKAGARVPRLQHVFVIIEENMSF